MASIFSHVGVAVAVGRLQPTSVRSARFLALSMACSILPDIDVAGLALGIPYDHVLGHRGLTHSLFFALLVSLLVVRTAFPGIPRGSNHWWSLVGHFFAVTASHGVLDAMTDGGLGVGFFAPFDTTRYFLPWTPIKVSPIGLRPFFSAYGMEVLWNEFVWVGIPVGIWWAGVEVLRRRGWKGFSRG